MPNIYDNVQLLLGRAPQDVMSASAPLKDATAADFCVGYFNLRGWDQLADLVERLPGDDDGRCRVLVGMYRPAFGRRPTAVAFGLRLDCRARPTSRAAFAVEPLP